MLSTSSGSPSPRQHHHDHHHTAPSSLLFFYVSLFLSFFLTKRALCRRAAGFTSVRTALRSLFAITPPYSYVFFRNSPTDLVLPDPPAAVTTPWHIRLSHHRLIVFPAAQVVCSFIFLTIMGNDEYDVFFYCFVLATTLCFLVSKIFSHVARAYVQHNFTNQTGLFLPYLFDYIDLSPHARISLSARS